MLTKTNTAPMRYEESKAVNKPSAQALRRAVNIELDRFSDGQMLLHIAKRRKFGLAVTANVLTLAAMMHNQIAGLLHLIKIMAS